MPDSGSFPALERLKTEAEGLEVLIEHAPYGTAAFLEYLFELDYTDRKQAILDQRQTVKETYQTHRSRVEQTYGSAVVRVLKRRQDREQPQFDTERMKIELDDATAILDELHETADKDYLTRSERKRLTDLTADVTDAREYIRNKTEFDQRTEALEPALQQFQTVFEPYTGATQFMVSSDHERLIELSHEIWTELASLARELVLPILPDEDAEWLTEQKTRFGDLVDYLPEYNKEFVANEREAYADLLVTDHGPLNNQQQKAVIRNDRRNLVDASAGTGKTLTLTYRFIYLLEKGVPVQNIAAITYTGDAAEEMKGRIAAATTVKEDELNISTIHSFANKIYQDAQSGDSTIGSARKQLVQSYHDAAANDVSPSDDMIDYPDCYEAFKNAYDEFLRIETEHGEDGYINEHKGYHEDRADFVHRKLKKFVEKARSFDLSATDIRRRLDGTSEVRDTFGEAGAAIVEAYNRRVDEQEGPTDFDDMIYTATKIVESNPERFGSQYSHILVDEFQDVTDSTLAFVESFMGGDSQTHLFCVGDDWQGIFGFTGSNIRHFTEYQDRFSDVTYTQLQINYRCPPAIVEAGSTLMDQSNAPQNEKEVVADSDVDTTPTAHVLDTLYKARAVPYVADMIESKLAFRSPDEIMVLSRNDDNSQYMEELRRELERRNIPHRRPKYTEDYLPEEYVADLPFDVSFDEKGFVEYDVPAGAESPVESPPIVQTQSIHSSKGTEAPVVILLHCVGDDPDGIPIEKQTNKLLDPAMDITAKHIPEERRLFYVALTRTEEEFHAVTRSGEASRYLSDIRSHLRRQDVPFPDEVVGRCTSYEPSCQPNDPIKATLECKDFDVPLLAWPNQDPPELQEGAIYRIKLTDPDRQISQNDYGTEIRFDRAPIEQIKAPTSPNAKQ